MNCRNWNEMGLSSRLVLEGITICYLVSWFRKSRLTGSLFEIPATMSMKKKSDLRSKVEKKNEMSVLDLPDLVLENILGRLPPSGLCNMAGVCRSLRDTCRSDRLWEKHMKEKWGSVIGSASYREGQQRIASMHVSSVSDTGKSKGGSKPDGVTVPTTSSFLGDSLMSLYLSLESGKLWFPAQVYHRKYTLSCYDGELRYVSHRDNFQARYPRRGQEPMEIEEGVKWERLRAPPVPCPPYDLHVSDCLDDLRPGDHFEVQWRQSKEYPFGWWYGVVGHLESCHRSDHCLCHISDSVVLEFNQYRPDSQWARASINRKDREEEGNLKEGFYGGVMKLHREEEILTWKRFFPTNLIY